MNISVEPMYYIQEYALTSRVLAKRFGTTCLPKDAATSITLRLGDGKDEIEIAGVGETGDDSFPLESPANQTRTSGGTHTVFLERSMGDEHLERSRDPPPTFPNQRGRFVCRSSR